jgi:hypothetical protein
MAPSAVLIPVGGRCHIQRWIARDRIYLPPCVLKVALVDIIYRLVKWWGVKGKDGRGWREEETVG